MDASFDLMPKSVSLFIFVHILDHRYVSLGSNVDFCNRVMGSFVCY